MMKWLILWLLFPLAGFAQTYRYLGVEDGLSNRRVYYIQKDSMGYMWFLTHAGIDRYDGKHFKSYELIDNGTELNSMLHLNWLYTDSEGGLWQIGKKGRIFRYSRQRDRFECVFRLPAQESAAQQSAAQEISFGWLDPQQRIWLCGKHTIYLYDTRTGSCLRLPHPFETSITDIEAFEGNRYFIGTEKGVQLVALHDSALTAPQKADDAALTASRNADDAALTVLPCETLASAPLQVNDLLYCAREQQLYIGTFKKGIWVYNAQQQSLKEPNNNLKDIGITRIIPLNEQELLVATDGAGVYRLGRHTPYLKPYIAADYNSYNGMNGNCIRDIFVDNQSRIWMANYPIGITVRDNRYSPYKWIKHSIGNSQTLVNNQVNAIIEDSEGDLWFATNNGISLLRSRTGQWQSFLSAQSGQHQQKLSSGQHQQKLLSGQVSSVHRNHIFITLCEVQPGIIWTGGYSSGIFEINKRTGQTQFFNPSSYQRGELRPDKYIRDIHQDADGLIWIGGHYNLKSVRPDTQEMKLYPGLQSITTLAEKDHEHLWIGSASGLYLLHKKSGKHRAIPMPVESLYINSLYQSPDGRLYIGTSGSGLLVYNPKDHTFQTYHTNNSQLISNNIYTILSDEEGSFLLATENGLSSFYPREQRFNNWTQEMGLMSTHFNALSGTLRQNGTFILGSADGVIEFSKHMMLPPRERPKMIFSDFKLFYQTVYPGDPNSPLQQNINETTELSLKHNQNIFSLMVSSINFDYPSNVLYSWKLDGFYNEWSKPDSENIIRYTNLAPGHYTLHVRMVSKEDHHLVLGERQMHIHIAKPFWLSYWALLFYLLLLGAIITAALRIVLLRKRKKESEEKIKFFINTAHDIRTPLTLIKAPLEDLQEREPLSPEGRQHMETALRNVNALLRLTTNLINFERTDVYASELYVSEQEANSFMRSILTQFEPFAQLKHIRFTYTSNFKAMPVWFDRDKMESILKNLVSNALKYTPVGGEVSVTVTDAAAHWTIEVKDTGIGIPHHEQANLFKLHFRGSNAINAKITGSGIGLMLVWKLVKVHEGKISLHSVENEGTSIRVQLPKQYKDSQKLYPSNKTERGDKEEKGEKGYEMQQDYSDEGVLQNEALQKAVLHNAIPESHDIHGTPESHGTLSNSVHGTLSNEAVSVENSRLLIIEDNDELRAYLQQTLNEEYTVQTCSNGKEALLIIPEYQPELILSDIMMPEMRGDELCARLKNDIETSHIPIILLTALSNEKDILSGLQIGADEYIPKPFNTGILKAKIHTLLMNRAWMRRKYASIDPRTEEMDPTFDYSQDIDWKFIANVRKQIEDNIDNPSFNVDTLCNLVGMSRTSFYNKLRALTDQAPTDYIRLIRLKRAAELLREGGHSITEVAELTGFSDAKYFREVFKKHFNVTPTQFSKNQQPESEN